jgi:hypothetical protein
MLSISFYYKTIWSHSLIMEEMDKYYLEHPTAGVLTMTNEQLHQNMDKLIQEWNIK